jgi:hypothetical protein
MAGKVTGIAIEGDLPEGAAGVREAAAAVQDRSF